MKKCNVNYLPQHIHYWIHLNSIDAWLYSLPQSTVVQILCPGEQHRLVKLEGVEILKIQPHCYARQDHITLVGMKGLGFNTESLYTPEISLNIINIDNLIYHKLETINTSLHFPTIKKEHTTAKFESRLTLQDIQEKYDSFITDQNNKIIHSYFS